MDGDIFVKPSKNNVKGAESLRAVRGGLSFF